MEENYAGYDIVVDTTKVGEEIEKIITEISTRVIGQSRAVSHILRVLVSERSGLRDPDRPLGIIILAGPSGVGKSFTAKETAKAYLGGWEKRGNYPLTVVQCSSFSQDHQTASLIGSPAGYVGYSDLPILHWINIYKHHLLVKIANRIEKCPTKEEYNVQDKQFQMLKASINQICSGRQNVKVDTWSYVEKCFGIHQPLRSVILFDEIEKAHPKFWDLLLPILEEGKLQLANGEITDFRNSFIILTTNTGSREIQNLMQKPIGFAPANKNQEKLDQAIYEEAKKAIGKTFPAEFIGRFGGEIVVFRTLGKDDYFKILENFLTEAQTRLSGRRKPISVNYTRAFKEFLVEEGISQEYGARILRTKVKRYVMDAVSSALSSRELTGGDKILFDLKDGMPILRRQERTEAPKPLTIPITVKTVEKQN